MRKKYLSALLFGALLFASAGTFTSCKDYDDDINNLQEQINTINTTLTELKSQIGTAGVSSVTFDETTGILTVTDGTGTKNYNIATSAAAMVKAEIKDGKLYVNGEEIGDVVGDVTVTEDGKLMVDSVEVAVLGQGDGSDVVLLVNEDTQTCTLTVKGQTVTLPLNADANTAVTVDLQNNDGFYSLGGVAGKTAISWGIAEEANAEWEGPKGAIEADQFMVGQIDVMNLSVSPYNYDLQAQKLTLVDTEGKTAPVNVTATPEITAEDGKPATGGRAASVNGNWSIAISMKEDVTADNIATVFGDKNGYVLYALAVNGEVVSPYDIAIKTSAKASEDCAAPTKANINGEADVELKVGKNDVVLANANVYDSYLKFEGAEATRAEMYGVSVDGMTVTVKDDTYAGQTLKAKVYAMTVDGVAHDAFDVNLKIGNTTIETPSQAPASEYKLGLDASAAESSSTLADQYLWLNVKDMFTAADGLNLAAGDLTVTGLEDFIYTTSDDSGVEKVTASVEGLFQSDKSTAFDGAKEAISKLEWAKVKISKSAGNLKYKTDIKPGTYQLTVTYAEAGNEIRKFTSDVKVSLASFDEIFAKAGGTVWNGDKFTATIGGSSSEPSITLNNAFTSNVNGVTPGTALAVTGLTYGDKKQATENELTNETLSSELKLHIGTTANAKEVLYEVTSDNYEIAQKTLKATVTYKLSADNEDFQISKTFDVVIGSVFENVELPYYVNGVTMASDGTVKLNDNDAIVGLTGDGDKTPYNGWGIKLNGDPISIYNAMKTTSPSQVSGFDIVSSGTSAANEITYSFSVENTSYTAHSTPAEVSDSEEGIVIKPESGSLTAGQGGTLIVKFVDHYGIIVTKKINFAK